MYEIIDDTGVLFSGTEDEMITAFDDIINNNEESEYHIDEWNGDIKLIKVINIYR
jgi:hypothetical protein